MKVFDCQKMPKTVRDELYKSKSGTGNDCYVHIFVPDLKDDFSILDRWLHKNGADLGERVLVKYWW